MFQTVVKQEGETRAGGRNSGRMRIEEPRSPVGRCICVVRAGGLFTATSQTLHVKFCFINRADSLQKKKMYSAVFCCFMNNSLFVTGGTHPNLSEQKEVLVSPPVQGETCLTVYNSYKPARCCCWPRNSQTGSQLMFSMVPVTELTVYFKSKTASDSLFKSTNQ